MARPPKASSSSKPPAKKRARTKATTSDSAISSDEAALSSSPRARSSGQTFDIDQHYERVKRVKDGKTIEMSVCPYTKANGEPCLKEYSRWSGYQYKEKHYKDNHLGQMPFSCGQVDEPLLEMITNHNLPLSIADSPILHKLLRRSINSQRIAELAVSKTNQKRMEIKERMRRATSVCLTIDFVFKSRKRGYVCYTAHYIVDAELYNEVIAFRAMPYPFRSEDIPLMTDSIVREYDCESKLLAITCYGAGASKNHLDLMKDDQVTCLTTLPNVQTLYCASHLIHQAVKAAVSNTGAEGAIKRARNLAKAIKFRLSNKLKESCDATKTTHLEVKTDVSNRWLTTYETLRRLKELKEAIIHLQSLDDFYLSAEEQIREEDWSLLERLEVLFKGAANSSAKIAAAKVPTLPYVISNYRGLINVSSEFLDDPLVGSIAKRFKDNLVACKDKLETDFTKAANYLMPRDRRRCFQPEELVQVRAKITELALSFELAIIVESVDDSPDSPDSLTEAERSFSFPEPNQPSIIISHDPLLKEFEIYEGAQIESKKKGMIQWWEYHKTELPNLYRVVMMIFASQATCVASDRVLAAASHASTDVRNHIPDPTFEDQMILHFASGS